MTPDVVAEPSPPPRVVTSHARRRAWAEPRVRFWWALSLVLAVVGVVLAIGAVRDWQTQKYLIVSGHRVNALVGGLAGKQLPPDALVELSYEFDGKQYQSAGVLQDRTDFILLGSTIPIIVDPADPRRWTARTVAPPLIHQLLAVLLILPVVGVTLLMSMWQRWRLLRLYKHGEVATAVVVEARPTAIAPFSLELRCTLAGGDNRRVFSVLFPGRHGTLARGDALWLYTDRQRAVPAVVFE